MKIFSKRNILILTIIISCSMTANAANYFIIRDRLGEIGKYEINENTLDKFATLVRINCTFHKEYMPFLTDIYMALKQGYTVTYYQDTNTVNVGGYTWTSLSPKELKRMHGKESRISATVNSKKHRFYMALATLKSFKLDY